MNTKYNEGDEVYDRIRPGQKLIVSRHQHGMYYCKRIEHRNEKELIYFERELMSRAQYTSVANP